MAKKPSKDYLNPHSAAKVRLLGEYLGRYLSVISNAGFSQRIHLYDLFCGRGIYDGGGEGSPLVIMRAINDLVRFGNVRGALPAISCTFNDINPAHIESTKLAIEAAKLVQPPIDRVQFTVKDYEVAVKELIDFIPTLGKEKAFVFIDPYGYKHIRASDIKALLKDKKSEVLLFLPIQFIYRFDNKGTPESWKDFVDELVQYENWKKNDSEYEFIEQLTTGFRRYMGEELFVDRFTILKDPNTQFALFFFSSHIRGFEKMLEAKWEIDKEEGRGWAYHNNIGMFATMVTNELEEKLTEFLKVPRTNKEVYEFTLHAGFLPKHTNEIFKNWQDNRSNFTVTTKEGTPARKGAFYINYENYFDTPDRVKMQLH